MKCEVPQCNRDQTKNRASGWCEGHWYHNYRYGSPTPERTCTDCGASFNYINSEINAKIKCVECNSARKQLPESIRTTLFDHGVTSRQYINLYDSQNGRCKLCGYKPIRGEKYSRYALEIDHDRSCCKDERYNCGKCVRGLLCQDCNIMIGKYELCRGSLVIPVFDEYIQFGKLY